jgi:hypothetical protein
LFFSFLRGYAFLVLPDDNAWNFFSFREFPNGRVLLTFLLDCAKIPSGKVILVTPDRGVWKFRASWLQGWPNNSRSQGFENLVLPNYRVDPKTFLMARLIFSFLWDFSNCRAYLIFLPFQGQNHDCLSFINSMILFLSSILLDYIEAFSCNK